MTKLIKCLRSIASLLMARFFDGQGCFSKIFARGTKINDTKKDEIPVSLEIFWTFADFLANNQQPKMIPNACS